MNVAIMIDTLVGGGAEMVVRQLARGVARRGHGAFVYCLKNAGCDLNELETAGVTVREARSFGREPLLAWKLFRWMRRDRIQVVNAHSSAALCWALPPAKTLGIPVIQTRHGAHLGKPAFYPRWARRLVRLADRVTIVAESLRSGIPVSRLAREAVYLPNGVDCEPVPRQQARQDLERLCGQPLHGPVVLSVGTVCPEKDPLTLVEAFARLRDEVPEAQLIVAGAVRGESYGQQVLSRVESLGLNNCVHWLGHIPNAWRLMSGADVFCQSSRTEAMPIAILEAMSQSVPIVATTVGNVGRLDANSECEQVLLRHNETGLLVPPSDPNALAEALHCVLNDPRASRERAARAAADYARLHTGRRMVRRYENVYADCLCRRGKLSSRPTEQSEHRRPAVVMLGPAPPQIGGMVTSIGLLMKSPLREKYELHRVGTTVDPTRDAESGPPRGVQRLATTVGAIGRHVAALAKLAWLLIDKRISILHIHTCSYFTFYRHLFDLAVAKLLGRAVILHVRGGMFERFCAGSGRFGRWVIRRGLEAADAVIVLSQGWYNALRPYAGNARLVVVPNAFDPDAIPTREYVTAARAARKESNPDAPCRFLFLALVREIKGVGDLIEAARMLRVLGTPFELYIAGPATDGDGARWEQQVRDAGLEDVVTFTGPVSGSAKAHQLACADCFVHPSHSEGLPNSVLEGGAAGLPVIATTVGAVPEVFSPPDLIAAGETDLPLGPLVSPHDPPALAREMDRLARDASPRREIGERLRQRFNAEYSLERLAERISPIYEQILGQSEICTCDEPRAAVIAEEVEPAVSSQAEALPPTSESSQPRVVTPVLQEAK